MGSLRQGLRTPKLRALRECSPPSIAAALKREVALERLEKAVAG
jgi:hypothetical protein